MRPSIFVNKGELALARPFDPCTPLLSSHGASPHLCYQKHSHLSFIHSHTNFHGYISTVCPWTKGQHVTERIDALNAGLWVLCDKEKCTFVNNDESFKLSNGWANNGYILDGVHLNYAGTNRLVKNLSLAIKKGHQGDICRRKHATKPPHTHQAAARPSQPASNHQTYRSYQPSQGDMLPAIQNRNQHPLTTQKHRHHEQRRAESWEQVDGPQHTYNDSETGRCPRTTAAKPIGKILTLRWASILEMNRVVGVISAVSQITARIDVAMVNPSHARLVGSGVTNQSIIISARSLAKKGVPLVLMMRHM